MKPPKISVITPSYNQGEFIEDTIRSVLDQNYPNLEYIIIDGGSTDNSVEVICKYESRLSYWVSEKDRGQTHAINKGFARATGDVLAWLNSDDFYCAGSLDCIAQARTANPQAGLYMGNGFLTDREGNILRRYANNVGFSFDSLLKGSCYVLQPATFISREAVERLGELDESLNYGMDLEYWLRVGREFPVLVMDEPLACYRWYEEIKTNEGFARWVELWQIYRRYTDQEITPGLLVEFFNILKKDNVLKGLEIEARALAEQGFARSYAAMQQALDLRDCIPVGQGIRFAPVRKTDTDPEPQSKAVTSTESSPAPGDVPPGTQPGKSEPAGPAIVRRTGTRPRVDVVLQATGVHAWGVGEGWKNAASRLGVFNRLFVPRARWGQEVPDDDDGLYDYLKNPQADLMLLMGFEWHSQMLHANRRWRERWQESPLLKILYSQESIENNCRLFGNDLMRQALLSAARCVDAIVYTDITDRELMDSTGRPALWQPFGVDAEVFGCGTTMADRIPKAFFRGKTTPFFNQSTYSERRELIEFLQANEALELLPYLDRPVTAPEIAADFNRYRVAVNFPSIFANHPTRVYEAMACGCALVTNRTDLPEVDGLFEDGRHLLYYSGKEELLDVVRRLETDLDLATRLADEGRRHVLEHYTLTRHLDNLVNWLDAEKVVPPQPSPEASGTTAAGKPKGERILIDGVIFFLQKDRPAGISRVWKTLLTHLADTPLAERIILLDRGGTAPVIPGIRRRRIDEYDFRFFEDDPLMMEEICREEEAGLFISTYYTFPEHTHVMMMLHDMIPEVMAQDLSLPEWRSKTMCIERSAAYLCVSRSTRDDFRRIFPQFEDRPVYLTPNAVSDTFQCPSEEEVRRFKSRLDLKKPYYLLSGHRMQYKNAILFFRAFSLLADRANFEIVCTGGSRELEPMFRPFVNDSRCRVLFLDDRDLPLVYAGATALVYPSRYEGFGLPLLEAMKAGCPVITCRNSSLGEVAGDAAIYVGESDVAAMRDALVEVRRPEIRQGLVAKGFENAECFAWPQTARRVAEAITETAAAVADRPLNSGTAVNTGSRLIYRLAEKYPQATALQAAMKNIKQAFSRLIMKDDQEILRWEATVAAMEPRIFRWALEEFHHSTRHDALFCYWLALAAECRGEQKDALSLYLMALKRVKTEWLPLYHFRVALRGAELAMGMELKPLALQLYREVVRQQPMLQDVRRKFVDLARELGVSDAIGAGDDPLVGDTDQLTSPVSDANRSPATGSRPDHGSGRQSDKGGILNEIMKVRESGDLPGALKKAEGAILDSGPSPDLVNQKAEILLEMERLDEAHSLLQEAVETWPADTSILNNLAVAEAYRENFPAAVRVLERVLELDPADDIARDNLGRLREIMPPSDAATDSGTGINEAPAVQTDRSPGRCRVSAIVSTFASERFMAGRLQNLLDQSLGDELEIIVIDSNSPENEGAIVEEFARSHRNIRYVRTSRRETIYQAWNRAIDLARGEFVTNANTDDRLSPDALATLARALESHPEAVLAYGDYFVTTQANQDFSGHVRSGYNIAPDYSPAIMLHACHMGPQPMWRRSVHDTHGYFDKSFRIAGDYEFWCRLAVHHDFLHVPEFVGLYYHNPTGAVNRDQQRSLQETEKVWARYSGQFPSPAAGGPGGRCFVDLTGDPDQYAHICLVTANHLSGVQETVRSIMALTRFPYVISVADLGSTDGTRTFLRQAVRRGLIGHLQEFDASTSEATALAGMWNARPDATYAIRIEPGVVVRQPEWLGQMVQASNGNSTARIVAAPAGNGPGGDSSARAEANPSAESMETDCLLLARDAVSLLQPFLAEHERFGTALQAAMSASAGVELASARLADGLFERV